MLADGSVCGHSKKEDVMGQVTKIEVHFHDEEAGDQTVVIQARGKVEAVLWEKAPGFISLQKAGTTIEKKRERPVHVTLLPDTNAVTSGPDGVCYLEGGTLKCWGNT
jgi:hypothetical protein